MASRLCHCRFADEGSARRFQDPALLFGRFNRRTSIDSLQKVYHASCKFKLLKTKLSTRCEDSGISLEEFIREHDYHYYGTSDASLETPRKTTFGSTPAGPTLSSLNDLVNLHVVNSFDSFEALHAYLGQLNLLDPERLRPGWDTYFMQLATLASRRSNCMKRRVGAILVRNNRILSTGSVSSTTVAT